jgi:hypothetical protein
VVDEANRKNTSIVAIFISEVPWAPLHLLGLRRWFPWLASRRRWSPSLENEVSYLVGVPAEKSAGRTDRRRVPGIHVETPQLISGAGVENLDST